MAFRILVGSYTRDISTLSFDPVARTLRLLASTEIGHHPSWLAQHPADATLVYTGLEQAEGRVLALRVNDEGRVQVVAEAGAGGRDPASFEALQDELIVGNYSSGNVVVLRITNGYAPSIASTPSATHTLPFTHIGPNAERQEASHPHQIVYDALHARLFVPDLGADRTWLFERDAHDAWARTGALEYGPGSGPRHLVVHGEFVYTLCELDSTVVTHRNGHAQPIARTSTMIAPPEPLGAMLAAEIALYPPPPPLSSSQDLSAYTPRFLYATNRNFPGAVGDPLAIFDVSDPATPKLLTEVPTGLAHMRGMAVSPDGRWVVAGGAKGGGAKVFEVLESGAELVEVARCEVGAPTSFLWL